MKKKVIILRKRPEGKLALTTTSKRYIINKLLRRSAKGNKKQYDG